MRISPQVGPGAGAGKVVGVNLTFNDQTFSRAFAAASPGPDVPSSVFPP